MAACFFGAFAAGVCSQNARERARADDAERPNAPALLDVASLPNAYRLNAQVISGGQPAGGEGFLALRQLGVRTIVSVDGAKPDVELARKYGLRYVHLPHGYDGIPPQRAVELAQAAGRLPGPVYIHCHHGRHRSPAAAAVACIGAGWMTPVEGTRFLEQAGTSVDYRGLYAVVASAGRQPDLPATDIQFHEFVEVPPLATAMVEIERTFDNLQRIERAGWKAPAEHPDLAASHEALLLREHYAELLRTDDTSRRPSAFRQHLADALARVELLERELVDARLDPTRGVQQQLSRRLVTLANDCRGCHRQHRDQSAVSD